MIILLAGAKEECKAEPFSDPRVAVGEELNLMTTFQEMQKGLKNKKRLRFLKGLVKRKRTGKSGKEFWSWLPGYEGEIKLSTKNRVRVLIPTKKNVQVPQKILSGVEAAKFLEKLKRKEK